MHTSLGRNRQTNKQTDRHTERQTEQCLSHSARWSIICNSHPYPIQLIRISSPSLPLSIFLIFHHLPPPSPSPLPFQFPFSSPSLSLTLQSPFLFLPISNSFPSLSRSPWRVHSPPPAHSTCASLFLFALCYMVICIAPLTGGYSEALSAWHSWPLPLSQYLFPLKYSSLPYLTWFDLPLYLIGHWSADGWVCCVTRHRAQ